MGIRIVPITKDSDAKRRKKTTQGIKGTPAEKRRGKPKPKKDPEKVALKKQMAKDSAGIKKFRKDLAKARKFAAEMGQIRNTVGLQPGTKVQEEYKGPKRLTHRERNIREMKQYSISRTKTAPGRKPKSAE